MSTESDTSHHVTTGHVPASRRAPLRHDGVPRRPATRAAAALAVALFTWLFVATTPAAQDSNAAGFELPPASDEGDGATRPGIGGDPGDRPTTEPAWAHWTRVSAPSRHLILDTLVATPHGFAIASGPGGGKPLLWSSSDGETWTPAPVSMFPFGVIVHEGELVAFRGRSAVRLAWTGSEWREKAAVELPGYERTGYLSGRPGLVVGPAGMLAQTVDGEVFWSGDGRTFEQTIEEGVWGDILGSLPNRWCSPPSAGSLDPAPIVASGGGFIAMVPGREDDPYGRWPVCEPVVWASRDGRAWSPVTDGTPFGAGAYVYDAAWGGGRFVASGGTGAGRPIVWVSDDGVTWDRIELTSSDAVELVNVDAGGAGWILLGDVAGQSSSVGWASSDTVCWHRLPDEVQGRVAAVGADRIVVADRRHPSVMWLGAVTGDDPGCDR